MDDRTKVTNLLLGIADKFNITFDEAREELKRANSEVDAEFLDSLNPE